MNIESVTSPHQNIANAMALGRWDIADQLAGRVAEATAQGDVDAVYGAAYATYREQAAR